MLVSSLKIFGQTKTLQSPSMVPLKEAHGALLTVLLLINISEIMIELRFQKKNGGQFSAKTTPVTVRKAFSDKDEPTKERISRLDESMPLKDDPETSGYRSLSPATPIDPQYPGQLCEPGLWEDEKDKIAT